MSDDWKGEHHIRRKPDNNRKEATRLINVLYHQARRKAGLEPAGAKKHKAFILSAVREEKT